MHLDVQQFWKDDEIAHRENCFFDEAPQIALGMRMGEQCVFSELSEVGDPWARLPAKQRLDLNKRYNDKAEIIVGKRLLWENTSLEIERCMGKRLTNPSVNSEDERFPAIKRIGEVFGGTYHFRPGSGEWLHCNLKTTEELELLLDRVEQMEIRTFILPCGWDAEKKRIFEKYGKRPGLLRHIRGPITLATSIFGIEPLVYLYYDAPELFVRFGKTIEHVIISMAQVMDEEAGYMQGQAPGGFSFADDDCSLFTPEMYAIFGIEIIKNVYDTFCPNSGDERYLHADSDMGHLLPMLGAYQLTVCNLGPKLGVDEIRKHLPHTRIDGCLSPMTFMSNERNKIFDEVKRDCERAKTLGIRGLNIDTAGVINPTSKLSSMRVVMEAIQTYGRY